MEENTKKKQDEEIKEEMNEENKEQGAAADTPAKEAAPEAEGKAEPVKYQVSSTVSEEDRKTFLEQIREFLKWLLERLKIFPQFSVFAQQVQRVESRLDAVDFTQQAIMDELDNMKQLLVQCKTFTNDMSVEGMRIKNDMNAFISKDTTLTFYEHGDDKYFVFENPNAYILYDRTADGLLTRQPDTLDELVKENLRVYKLSPGDGFVEITKNIQSVDDLETVRMIKEAGEEVKDGFSDTFNARENRGEKLVDADNIIGAAIDKCLKEVSECEKQVQERLVESYEGTLADKTKTDKQPDKDEIEMENER